MKNLFSILILAVGITACPSATPEKPAKTPEEASPDPAVPMGYRGLAWGASRERVLETMKDLRPSDKSEALVRDTTIEKHPAKEAFLFDESDGLAEVDIRLSPKLTPEAAAALARLYDSQYGPHEVTRADDSRYQFVWRGADTRAYFTYDISEKFPAAPILTYTQHTKVVPEPVGPTPSDRFAADGLAAMLKGFYLTDIASGRQRLEVTLAHGPDRFRMTLLLGAQGEVTGYENSEYTGGQLAAPQGDAEIALKVRLATVGGPVAVIRKDNLSYLLFYDGSYMAAKPGAKSLLIRAGGDLPTGVELPKPSTQAPKGDGSTAPK